MLADFKKFLADEARVMIDEDGWTKDLAFIRAMIRYDIDLALFAIEDARRHLVADDPQAQFALSLFGEAERPDPPDAARRAARPNRRPLRIRACAPPRPCRRAASLP